MTFEPVPYTTPKQFVNDTTKEYRRVVSTLCPTIACVSGGIDSSVSAAIAHRAEHGILLGIHFDDAVMREGECKEVLYLLNKHVAPTTFYDFSDYFLEKLEAAGSDAEKKRIEGITKPYFEKMLELANKWGTHYVVQGTINPDVTETVSEIKRQHNVLLKEQKEKFEKEGITIIEPLYHLTKDQVREVARYLDLPPSITERKPFPGPGLSIRAVGQITKDKMKTVRSADHIVMPHLEKDTNCYAKEDFQCFCAIMDNKTTEIDVKLPNSIKINSPAKITENKVTGVVEGKRTYANMLLIDSPNKITDLIKTSNEIVQNNLDEGVGRVAALVERKSFPEKKYIAVLRSILTRDFRTAEVTPLPFPELKTTTRELLMRGPQSIVEVYYDVTPKPPGTIEFE